MYESAAFLYEATAAFERPDALCDELERGMARHGLRPPALVGDLGAGTGLVAAAMAERGWHVYGVERSPAMLAEARAKTARMAPALRECLSWSEGDIRDFAMPEGLRLDAALCLCNTVNHLLEGAEVERFLGNAWRALRPGGLLLLDTDDLEAFHRFFDFPPTVVWDDGRHRLTRACAFDAGAGRAHHLAVLERAGAAARQETTVLQYHAPEGLRAAFAAAGFALLEALAFNPLAHDAEAEPYAKTLWVLQKPAGA